jgi:DNA (cytosine-5)-methyltransferase 1|tara:strand:- start:602 stop:1534 length:933 start_codon:yes stop_codon:yes gene_type:complete
MNYLSICSGIDAVTVAWKPMGWKALGVSEIDPFRKAVLDYHYPDIKNFGDFTEIKKDDFREPIDLLVGGTPCVSFSMAGLREGITEDRGNLALEFIKLAQRLRPKWLLWENVAGVLSSNRGRDLGSFLGALAQCGYGFAYRVLDTSLVRTQRFPRGIPQRRRRIFVVGHHTDWRKPIKVLFKRQSLSKNVAPSRGKRIQVSETDRGTINTTFAVRSSFGGGFLPERAYTLMASELQYVSYTDFLGTHLRKMTPVEYERLQGFPDNYTQVPYKGKSKEECSDLKRYEACGRSMSINVMEWLGKRIEEVENE